MLARVRGGGGGGGGGSPATMEFGDVFQASAVPAKSRVRARARVVLNSLQPTFLRSKVTQASPASEGSVSISACNHRIGTSTQARFYTRPFA